MSGMIRADYDNYLILGETRCVSIWLFLFRSFFYPQKRVFLWSHGWLEKGNMVKILISKQFYGFCDGAFIYNERSQQLMIEGGIPAQKLTTISNSLDYDKQLPLRQQLTGSTIYRDHFLNDNKTIVFIGRLTPVKRLDILIEAVAQLKHNGEVYNLVFEGDGTERERQEQMIRDNGLHDTVWFFGACYDEHRNAKLVFNADLCVSPGNIGLKAMHVMMFGRPAITNDDFNHQMPEFEAITAGMTGDFYKAGDTTSLADCISHWFSVHIDDREAIRRACYAEIDAKWNPHNQISILKEVLNKTKTQTYVVMNQQLTPPPSSETRLVEAWMVKAFRTESECLTSRHKAA